jgi:hypothetical protein
MVLKTKEREVKQEGAFKYSCRQEKSKSVEERNLKGRIKTSFLIN